MNKITKENHQRQEPIELNRGMGSKLMKKYGCSNLTVKNALTYVKNSPLHQAIRHDAKIMIAEWMRERGIEVENI